MEIRVRPATTDDMMLVYRWSNDQQTRAASFNKEPIPLDAHVRWFNGVLKSNNIHLLIIEIFEEKVWVPFAQARFDENSEIHVSLAPEYRNRKLAAPAIEKAVSYASGIFSIKRVVAHIKPDNIQSIKAFEKAGFVFSRKAGVKGQICMEYVCQIKAE